MGESRPCTDVKGVLESRPCTYVKGVLDAQRHAPRSVDRLGQNQQLLHQRGHNEWTPREHTKSLWNKSTALKTTGLCTHTKDEVDFSAEINRTSYSHYRRG